LREVLRKSSTPLVAALLAMTAFMAYSNIATATHQPADKVQATGSDLEHVTDDTVVLSETMRVSSPADLILQVTAECSILTELTTGPSAAGTGGTAATDTAFAYGSVRLHVEIDGIHVPVATDETATGDDDDVEDNDADGNEVGEVTFCNRAYERTVTDGEDDGLDEEHDFIRTRTANAFNWFAIDAGEAYDVDNDNLLTINVIADYDTRISGDAVADAFVGSRTLIVEPVHSQNDQQVGPGPVEASPSSNGNGNGNGKP
jgi:hypothetical protein